jgi:hypothetical protein
MRSTALAACILACAAAAAQAAQWAPLRNSNSVALLVDTSSVKRKGDQVSLAYLIDYARPQRDALRQLVYRSTVTRATVRCKARTVLLGDTELYTGPKATGVLIATAAPAPREQVYAPIEKDTSDEEVWRHACAPKVPAATKP